MNHADFTTVNSVNPYDIPDSVILQVFFQIWIPLLICIRCHIPMHVLGRVVQSVTCLTADLEITRAILALSDTFVEIDLEIISTAILLPSADSGKVVVSYKRKYVH